jgi:hypothetical protein
MLLSLWQGRAGVAPGAWHARLLEPDARVQDFDNPFELVRYLTRPDPPPEPGTGGLR